MFGFIRDTGWQWLNKRILINKNEVSTKTTINVRLKYFIVPCCRRWHKHARAHSVNECPPTSAMTCFGDVAKTSRLRSSRPIEDFHTGERQSWAVQQPIFHRMRGLTADLACWVSSRINQMLICSKEMTVGGRPQYRLFFRFKMSFLVF